MKNHYFEQLSSLAAMSNQFGGNPEYVLAGGGNTSFKSEDRLWIKGSGTALATIRGEDFVELDRGALSKMWDKCYPEDEDEREAAVLADMMDARIEGESRRPSVETLLHDLFPQKYILHVHPAIVNGITCSIEGERAMKALFPDAVWIDACKPGYILALECKKKMEAHQAETGRACDLLFLQNHGIFFAADTAEKTGVLAKETVAILQKAIKRFPDFGAVAYDAEKAAAVSAILEQLYGEGQKAQVRFAANREILTYDPATESLSPDHIVYCKAKQLILPATADEMQIKVLFDRFTEDFGCKPKIAFMEGLGMFACGMSEKESATAESVMLDAIKVVAFAESFGGVSPMPPYLIDFIVNWEVESYRAKVST